MLTDHSFEVPRLLLGKTWVLFICLHLLISMRHHILRIEHKISLCCCLMMFAVNTAVSTSFRKIT